MTSSTDESKANTLPDPELNPLLNPLLAAHMGRWAEVYFTNPPEKRGEAVAELLRELEKTSPPVSPAEPAVDIQRAHAETDRGTEPLPDTARASWQSDAVQTSTIEPASLEASTSEAATSETSSPPKALAYHHACAACSYVNPPGQFFCGMCGTRLETTATWMPPITGAFSSPQRGEESREVVDHNSVEENSSDYPASPSGPDRERFQFPEPSSLPRQDYFPSFGAASAEPSARNYRLYTGVAVAILLAVLVYMGWRGTKLFTASTKPATPATTSAAPETQPEPGAGQPVAPQNEKNDTPLPTDAGPTTPAHAAPASPVHTPSAPAQHQPSQNQPSQNEPRSLASADHGSDSRRPSPVIANPATSPSAAVETSGAADFATAQKFLNGDAATPRNPAEAVPWLWRAVGKGNVQAAVSLSDLYLRGEGVAKNCDQARVLLDSAARKGGKAAADRLRNLQAFGCQ